MLRWLFLILLLLNGVLYGWFYLEQQRREQALAHIEQPVHGVASLELLSEVPGSILRLRQGDRSEEQGQRDREPGAEKGEVSSEAVGSSDSSLERFCYRIGPFDQPQGLEPWLGDGRLGQLELDRVQVGVRPPSYQVYVSAAKQSASRDELLRSMRSVGLEGEWVTEGPLSGKLLLGVYQSRSPALALEQALVGQGYDAAVIELAQPIYRYYLLLERRQPLEAGLNWLVSLLKNYPAAKTEKKSC